MAEPRSDGKKFSLGTRVQTSDASRNTCFSRANRLSGNACQAQLVNVSAAIEKDRVAMYKA